MSVVVIGDIHGHYKTFLKLLDKLKGKRICVAGDIIDKGPQSRQLLEFIMNYNIDMVRGNHEQLLLESIKDKATFHYWANSCGGDATLKSYKGNKIPDSHIDFLQSLPLGILYEDVKNSKGQRLLVSHAGFSRPYGKINPENKEHVQDCLWNRNAPVRQANCFQVIGHTPTKKPIVKSWYANIDTGCFIDKHKKTYKKHSSRAVSISKTKEYGVLTALEFPSMKIYQQDRVD